MKEQSIALLDTIDKRKKKYDDINKRLRNIQGDSSTNIQAIDIGIEADTVSLLDIILGDEVASYYLNECNWDGVRKGRIEEYGISYPIKDIEDVKKFVFRDIADANV